MSYGKPEKICNGEGQRYKKYLKKVAKRKMRILSKKLMNDAPKKYEYGGWSI